MSRKKRSTPTPVAQKPEAPRRPALQSWWTRLLNTFSKINVQRRPRKLQVVEVAGLGEKRFVAVVSFGREKFLIGGAAASVSLLTRLGQTDRPMLEPLRIPEPERIAL